MNFLMTLKSMYQRPAFFVSFFFIFLILTACSRQQQLIWLPAWLEATSLTVPRAGAAAVVYKNFIYVLGGVDGRHFLSSIERAAIDEAGVPGSWSVVADMPQARGFFDAVVIDEYLYIVGGGNGENGKNLLRSVYRASLADDGSIGEWQKEEDLLLPRRCVKIFENNRRLYALGGFGGALLDSVEYADLDSDGHLSPWKMSDEAMTLPRYVNAVKKSGDRVYVIGGHHQKNGSGIVEVESASLNDKDLHWERGVNKLGSGRYGLSAFAMNGYVFALGGLSGLEYLSSIEKYSNSDGQWRQTTELPSAMANFSTLNYKDYIYLLGGTTRQTYLKSVSYAQLNENGDIGILVNEKQAKLYLQENQKKSKYTTPLHPIYAHQGKVVDLILSEQYTYVQVSENGDLYWIAGPVVKLEKGNLIGFSEGVLMSGFYSKSLRRNFDKILFVGQLAFIE